MNRLRPIVREAGQRIVLFRRGDADEVGRRRRGFVVVAGILRIDVVVVSDTIGAAVAGRKHEGRVGAFG
jgi:hypothetical protein